MRDSSSKGCALLLMFFDVFMNADARVLTDNEDVIRGAIENQKIEQSVHLHAPPVIEHAIWRVYQYMARPVS